MIVEHVETVSSARYGCQANKVKRKAELKGMQQRHQEEKLMDMRQNAALRQRNADYRAEELDDLKRQHEMQEMKENEMVRSMPECPVGSVWVTEPSRSNVSMRVVASGLLPPQKQTLTQPAPSTGFEASLLPPGSGARAVHRDGPPSSPQPQERGRAGLHPSRHTLRPAQSEPQAHL